MRRRAVLGALAAGLGAGTVAAGVGRDWAEVARWSPVDHDEAWASLWDPGLVLHDVTVAGGLAYCAYWDAGTWILDVSTPDRPAFVGRVGDYSRGELATILADDERRRTALLEAPGNDHFVGVDPGNLFAVGGEGWDVESTDARGPCGIRVYDGTNPAAYGGDGEGGRAALSRIDPPRAADETWTGTWTTAHNFEVRGDRLYAAWYQGGVTIHDLSDPTDPRLLARWRDPEVARFWTARVGVPGEFFVANSLEKGTTRPRLYVFPDRPGRQRDPPSLGGDEPFEPLATLDVDGAREAVVAPGGRTAYVAAGNGFVAVDLADPADPAVVAERTDLLAAHEAGPLTSVVDLDLDRDGGRLAVPGEFADGEWTALVYDVSDPTDPRRVPGRFDAPASIHNLSLAGGYLYLAGNGPPGNPLVVARTPDAPTPGRTTGTTTGDAGGGNRTATSPTRTTGDRADPLPTPGFGVAAALSALGIGVARRLGQDDGD